MKDELTELMRASEESPLPWGKQKRMVELFWKLLEDTMNEHKIHVEKLQRVVKNLEEVKKIKKELEIAC